MIVSRLGALVKMGEQQMGEQLVQKDLTTRTKCDIFQANSETDQCFARTFLLLARVVHQPIGLVHLALDSERAGDPRANWNVNPDRRIVSVWVLF